MLMMLQAMVFALLVKQHMFIIFFGSLIMQISNNSFIRARLDIQAT